MDNVCVLFEYVETIKQWKIVSHVYTKYTSIDQLKIKLLFQETMFNSKILQTDRGR
jgi:hypothetical protein